MCLPLAELIRINFQFPESKKFCRLPELTSKENQERWIFISACLLPACLRSAVQETSAEDFLTLPYVRERGGD